jgi:hypothetical protein
MPLMTQKEYAEHRGCTPPTVQDAKKVRIKPALVERGGKVLIDSEIADRLWDAAKVRNSHKGKGPASPAATESRPQPQQARDQLPSDDELQAFIQGLPEDQVPDLDESIRRKEHYNAERARVGALRDREEVGSIAEMKREAYALAKTIREGMLGIIPRVSADLAALTDQFDIERRLEEEILTALRMVADG